jgi:hypothetical protein
VGDGAGTPASARTVEEPADRTDQGASSPGPVLSAPGPDWSIFDARRCTGCGCTDDTACVTDAGPCGWMPDDPSRCTACGALQVPTTTAEHDQRDSVHAKLWRYLAPVVDQYAAAVEAALDEAGSAASSPAAEPAGSGDLHADVTDFVNHLERETDAVPITYLDALQRDAATGPARWVIAKLRDLLARHAPADQATTGATRRPQEPPH